MSTLVDQTKLLLHSIFWRAGIQASRISPYTNDGVALTAMLNHARIDLLLDVGANVGQYAKERIASGYSGQIVSFEPLSGPRAVLLKEASVWANWQVADQCAIGEHEGTVKMHISENSLASSILPLTNTHLNYAPRAVEIATEIVRLARLDEVAQPYLTTSQSPFLKIDVQGFEDQVIAGSTRILPKLAGLQLELSFMEMYHGQKLFPEMLAMIDSLGFTLYRLIPVWVDKKIGRWLQADGIFFRR